jgi:putative hydrolase of the HAD superfamily
VIKTVIFDVDNTLTDFMRTKRAAVDSAVDAMIGAGLQTEKSAMVEKVFEIYWKDGVEDQRILDKVLLKELGRIDYKILAAGILGYRRAKTGSMTLYPRVEMTLIELTRMGIKMGALSDAPRLEAWLRVVGLGLHHFFGVVVTAEDAGARKPAPAPFRKALELLGSKPAETVMVGDWAERDIAGAKRLGIRTAWAKYGDTHGTKDSGAEFVLEDIHGLVAIIRKENGVSA